MPKRAHDFVDWRDDWRNSRAKEQLTQDLKSGFIPLLKSEMTADEAQQLRGLYKEVERKKFKRNFESLRKSICEAKGRSMRDAVGLARDRERSATQVVNRQEGTRHRWDGSLAPVLLRQDMQLNLHLNKKELWQSRPEYYEHFTLRAFRDHIYAEERRQKRIAKVNKSKQPCNP
jgi:hypothetical protein